jgi:Predicted membrane protein
LAVGGATSSGGRASGVCSGGGGRWRVFHVGEGGDHGVFVALYYLHHVGAHVLGLFVALKVVDVFDALRDIFCKRFLQFLLGFVFVGGGRGTAAYGIDLARVTFRLSFAEKAEKEEKEEKEGKKEEKEEKEKGVRKNKKKRGQSPFSLFLFEPFFSFSLFML